MIQSSQRDIINKREPGQEPRKNTRLGLGRVMVLHVYVVCAGLF